MELYDLLICSREDDEIIDKFSSEHLTEFSLTNGSLLVVSTERKPQRFAVADVNFYFQGR